MQNAIRPLFALVLLAVLSLFVAPAKANPGDIPFAWDAQPGVSNLSYVLHAYTNFPTDINGVQPVVNVPVGTNVTGTISGLKQGTWYFSVTAFYTTNNLESLLSNIVTVEVPKPPANMRTVVLQYSGTISNFQDVGFFKLRLP